MFIDNAISIVDIEEMYLTNAKICKNYVQSIKLIYLGKELKRNKLLGHYFIKDKAVIQVFLKMKNF